MKPRSNAISPAMPTAPASPTQPTNNASTATKHAAAIAQSQNHAPRNTFVRNDKRSSQNVLRTTHHPTSPIPDKLESLPSFSLTMKVSTIRSSRPAPFPTISSLRVIACATDAKHDPGSEVIPGFVLLCIDCAVTESCSPTCLAKMV